MSNATILLSWSFVRGMLQKFIKNTCPQVGMLNMFGGWAVPPTNSCRREWGLKSALPWFANGVQERTVVTPNYLDNFQLHPVLAYTHIYIYIFFHFISSVCSCTNKLVHPVPLVCDPSHVPVPLFRFIMENGAKGVEVIISGKLRAQRAKVRGI